MYVDEILADSIRRMARRKDDEGAEERSEAEAIEQEAHDDRPF